MKILRGFVIRNNQDALSKAWARQQGMREYPELLAEHLIVIFNESLITGSAVSAIKRIRHQTPFDVLVNVLYSFETVVR